MTTKTKTPPAEKSQVGNVHALLRAGFSRVELTKETAEALAELIEADREFDAARSAYRGYRPGYDPAFATEEELQPGRDLRLRVDRAVVRRSMALARVQGGIK